MSHEVLERFTREYIECMADRGSVNFLWQGGEPTLMGLDFYKEAVELQRRYAPKGCTITNGLQTNGLMLDDEWCQFLASSQFLVGVSLDGPEALHNTYRHTKSGSGTHAQVENSIERMAAHGVDFNILCVVNNVNSRKPRDVYQYFKQLGAMWIQFIPAVERMPDGELSGWSVSPDAWGEFLCGVFEEWLKKDFGRINVQLFINALEAASGQNPSLCVHSRYCGNNIIVEHNGDIYACDHFVQPEHRLGNIMEQPLADLAQLPQQIEWGKSKFDGLTKQCGECPYLAYCHGGCLKDRQGVSRDGEPHHNLLCQGYYKFYKSTEPTWKKMLQWLQAGGELSNYRADLPVAVPVQAAAGAKRNELCPCGSGKKYKKCCGR